MGLERGRKRPGATLPERSPVRATHVYATLVLIASVYAGIQATLPHTAFLSNDGGAKLVQVKALASHESFDPSIPYDELGVEPDGSFRFAPFFPWYAFEHEGKMFSIVPFYFPLASLLPFSAFGHAGLFVLPLLGAILTVWLVAWVCAHTLGHAFALLAAVTTGLASSVFFYGLTFWEHTIAMCLAMAALAFFYKGSGDLSRFSPRLAAAGLFLALGAWMRTDVLPLAVGLGLTLLIRRRRRRQVAPLLAGLLVGLLPFLILNQIVYGSLSGPQIATGVANLSASGGFSNLMATRWSVTKYLLFTWVNQPWLNLLFFLVAICPTIYFSRIRRWGPRSETGLLAWIGFLLLTILATFLLLLSTPRLLRSSMMVLGLFVALPLLPFVLARPRMAKPRDDDGFYATLTIALPIALATVCLTIGTTGGLQWGPRYALVLFPPFVLLAVRGIADLHGKFTSGRRRRSFEILVALLLVGGVSVQALGIDLLKAKKLATVRNNEAIRATRPQAIITDTWWFPQDSGDLMGEIPIYEVRKGQDETDLLDGLYWAGIHQVLLVSATDLRATIAASPRMRLISFRGTHHPRTPTFDLFLHSAQLSAPPQRR